MLSGLVIKGVLRVEDFGETARSTWSSMSPRPGLDASVGDQRRVNGVVRAMSAAESRPDVQVLLSS